MRDIHPAALAALMTGIVLAAGCGKTPKAEEEQSQASGSSKATVNLPLGDAATCHEVCKAKEPNYVSCTQSNGMASCLLYVPGKGRAHEGQRPFASRAKNPVARWLEEAAHAEDASVTSFAILARELAAHGAPRALVREAERSARDEIRHARTMNALAVRHGGRERSAKKPSQSSPRVRSRDEMLRENAREGCVNETYAALEAWYQATHAADPKVRAAMKRIALDETRHAALAWKIDAWGTRAADRSDAGGAVEALHAALEREPDAEAARTLGLPSAPVARAMLRALVEALAA